MLNLPIFLVGLFFLSLFVPLLYTIYPHSTFVISQLAVDRLFSDSYSLSLPIFLYRSKLKMRFGSLSSVVVAVLACSEAGLAAFTVSSPWGIEPYSPQPRIIIRSLFPLTMCCYILQGGSTGQVMTHIKFRPKEIKERQISIGGNNGGISIGGLTLGGGGNNAAGAASATGAQGAAAASATGAPAAGNGGGGGGLTLPNGLTLGGGGNGNGAKGNATAAAAEGQAAAAEAAAAKAQPQQGTSLGNFIAAAQNAAKNGTAKVTEEEGAKIGGEGAAAATGEGAAKPAGEGAAAAAPAGEGAAKAGEAGQPKAVAESEAFSEEAGITLGADGSAQNLGGNLGITKGTDGSTSVGGKSGINVSAPAAKPAAAQPAAQPPAAAPAAPPAEA